VVRKEGLEPSRFYPQVPETSTPERPAGAETPIQAGLSPLFGMPVFAPFRASLAASVRLEMARWMAPCRTAIRALDARPAEASRLPARLAALSWNQIARFSLKNPKSDNCVQADRSHLRTYGRPRRREPSGLG